MCCFMIIYTYSASLSYIKLLWLSLQQHCVYVIVIINTVFQTRTEININSKHQTMSGLSFPISDEACHSLVDYKEGKVNFVHLVSFLL